ncbi:MAG: UDP-3-O-acyl-N-acetylglucosamine deacetylase [Bacteroidetes bacterium]|nr:UDP-3-O-acyl-N-acetylglucosamine deacetylase [Bacteroidota bacterium]
MKAKTIKQSISIKGIGLHSGKVTKIKLHPSNDGLYFIKNKSKLPVHVDYVSDTTLSVTLANHDFHIQTIEHFLYSLFYFNITDLCIEIEEGTEMPVMDGASFDFIQNLWNAGIEELEKKIEPISLEKNYRVESGDSYIVMQPSDSLQIEFQIDFPHPLLSSKKINITYDEELFGKKVAQARTFGFKKDIQKLQENGYGLGGNLENTLIFTETGTINSMLFSEEALYHKVLDLCGDLYLLGKTILAKISAYKSGHTLDLAIAKKILEDQKVYVS